MAITRRKFIKTSATIGLGAIFTSNFAALSEPKAKGKMLEVQTPDPRSWNNEGITLSWLGHSTVLINFYGKWILTDPVLSDTVGVRLLGATFGPTRYTPPALQFGSIPKPDLILLSHAHMDHTDLPTLRMFTEAYPNEIDVVTAYLTKDIIEGMPWKSVTSLDWNEKSDVADIEIRAAEVKHFGWRFPWEKDRSEGYVKDGRSYNSYYISKNGKTILFGGDTAYTDAFKKNSNIKADIAIMPIGAYDPWIKKHCTPEEALEMASHTGAEIFVPIHCMTFSMSNEPFMEPIKRMSAAAPKYGIKPGISGIGETLTL